MAVGGSEFVGRLISGEATATDFSLVGAVVSLTRELPLIYSFFGMLVAVVGVALVILGLKRFIDDPARQPHHVRRAGVMIAVGTLLVHLAPVMAIGTQSVFSDVAAVEEAIPDEVLAYDAGGGAPDTAVMAKLVVASVLAWVRLLGWVTFAVGLYGLKQLADGQYGGGREVTGGGVAVKLIGGVLAANIGATIDAIAATFGWL